MNGDILTDEEAIIDVVRVFNEGGHDGLITLFAVDNPEYKGIQNFIFLGLKSNEKIDFSSPEIKKSENEIIKNLSKKLIDIDSLNLDSAYLFTDNFAPVDYLIGKAI